MPATCKYIPNSHRVSQPSQQSTAVANTRDAISNSNHESIWKIISRTVLPGGSVSFLLRNIASSSKDSHSNTIEVPAEAIDTYVSWEDLQTFEHADFEAVEKESVKREAERKQLKSSKLDPSLRGVLNRGRGRPRKIRLGEPIPFARAEPLDFKSDYNGGESSTDESESEGRTLESGSSNIIFSHPKQDIIRAAGINVTQAVEDSDGSEADELQGSSLDNRKSKPDIEASSSPKSPPKPLEVPPSIFDYADVMSIHQDFPTPQKRLRGRPLVRSIMPRASINNAGIRSSHDKDSQIPQKRPRGRPRTRFKDSKNVDLDKVPGPFTNSVDSPKLENRLDHNLTRHDRKGSRLDAPMSHAVQKYLKSSPSSLQRCEISSMRDFG